MRTEGNEYAKNWFNEPLAAGATKTGEWEFNNATCVQVVCMLLPT